MKKIKNLLSFFLILFFISRCADIPVEPVKNSMKITLSPLSENSVNGRTETVIVNPPSGSTFNSGTILRITWDIVTCIGCGNWASQYMNIDLYLGNTYVSRIATNVPHPTYGYYDWLIPRATYLSEEYNVVLTSTSNSTQFTPSNSFTIKNSDDCYFSSWSLSGKPSGSILNNTTVQYKIQENGLAPKAHSNSPIIKVSSYYPINVIYNGTTYYCTGSGVNIPILGSSKCASNPIIDVPLKFVKIGTIPNTVDVRIQSLSYYHTFLKGYNGYHNFGVN